MADNIDTTMNASAESVDTSIVFGPTGDAGEYITPYQMTIVYHDDDPFELAVATLSSRAQLIPILRESTLPTSLPNSGGGPAEQRGGTAEQRGGTIDYLTIADSCAYLTPEVLIFGTALPREALQKFFDRGFQFIHILVPNEDAARKYMNPVQHETDQTAPTASPSSTPTSRWEYFCENIVTFGIDTLYEHVTLIEGLATMVALEHVILGMFPKYTSFNAKISTDDGRCFLRYIRDTKKDLRKTLLTLVSSSRGFETIEHMVISGRAMGEECEILASRRLEQSITYTIPLTDANKKFVRAEALVSAVPSSSLMSDSAGDGNLQVQACYGGDVLNELMHLTPAHPKITSPLVVFYHSGPGNSWIVTAFAPHGNVNVMEFLRATFTPGHDAETAGSDVHEPPLRSAETAQNNKKTTYAAIHKSIRGGNNVATCSVPFGNSREILPF